MSMKEIKKKLQIKGYEIEKITYIHPSGKLSDDFYEGGGWEVWIKSIINPILGKNTSDILKQIDRLQSN